MRLIELVIQSMQYFYHHMAEYPTHRRHLPPGIEEEFAHDLNHGSSSADTFMIHFIRLTF